MNYNVRARQR